MSCEGCKHDNLTDEAKAVRAASEMAQRYKFLCRAVAALLIGFVVMAVCMTWQSVNQQRIVTEAVTEAIKESQETMNKAMLEALYAVSEIEATTETTTTTQTVEGDSATINNVDGEQYNDNATNWGGE